VALSLGRLQPVLGRQV
jgi:hypothetical protein